MSKLFNANRTCEMALEMIGSLSINDESADPNELSRALDWLDLIMAELTGTERCFWLIPATISVPLTADTASYDLLNTMGADAPVDGVQFPYNATISDANGNVQPIEIVDRITFDNINKPASSGTPTIIWIDRLQNPTMKTYPVLATGVTGYSIDMSVQSFAPTFSGNGKKATGLRAAWQAWAIYELASRIGNGPVRRLPRNEVIDLKRDAAQSRARLLAYENREHQQRPRVVKMRSF